MKICYITCEGKPVLSKRWLKFFKDNGHEVHWFSLVDIEEIHLGDDIKGVNFYRIGKSKLKPVSILKGIFEFRKALKKIKPNLIHAHYAGLPGTVAAFSGFHPFVLTSWGSEILINPKKSFLAKIFIKFVLKKADLITCDAQHMVTAMRDLGGDEDKMKIIRFGVDTNKFFLSKDKAKVRNELGVKNVETIISIRSLEPVYNIETLILSIPAVVREVPNAQFLIFGDGSERKMLENLAKELKIENNIRFFGWVRNEDLPLCFQASDVYVSTSLSDAGIASSTAEAMASELPVVITNNGENKDWVKDNFSGFLILVKSPSVLAEKIIYLLKNKERRVEMGKEGRKVILEKNDYHGEMLKMEKLYEKVIFRN